MREHEITEQRKLMKLNAILCNLGKFKATQGNLMRMYANVCECMRFNEI